MAEFEVTTFVDRPPEEVFDYMTDPATASEWQGGTSSAHWITDEPIGAGSVYQATMKLMGRDMTVDTEITEWERPHIWGVKMNTGPMKVNAVSRFEPQDGGTLIIQRFEGEIGGFFNIAEGLAVKQLEKQVQSDGQTVKEILEGG